MVESLVFNVTVYVLIVGNTFTLALFRYDLTEREEITLSYANLFFTVAFTVEMVFKFIGLGVKNYMLDRFNLFDCLIVIISLVDLVLDSALQYEVDVLKIFRALRLLRTIKLARQWTTMKDMLRKMGASFIDISNFALLLFIMIFICALLGMELFAFSVAYDTEGELIYN